MRIVFCVAVVAAVMIVAGSADAQTSTTTDGPIAPVGHRQPTANVVPHNDSVIGVRAGQGDGSPARITPEEERENRISGGLCKTTTC